MGESLPKSLSTEGFATSQGVADIRDLFNYFTGLQPSVAQRESKALPSEFLTTIPSHLLEPPSGRLVGGRGREALAGAQLASPL